MLSDDINALTSNWYPNVVLLFGIFAATFTFVAFMCKLVFASLAIYPCLICVALGQVHSVRSPICGFWIPILVIIIFDTEKKLRSSP